MMDGKGREERERERESRKTGADGREGKKGWIICPEPYLLGKILPDYR